MAYAPLGEKNLSDACNIVNLTLYVKGCSWINKLSSNLLHKDIYSMSVGPVRPPCSHLMICSSFLSCLGCQPCGFWHCHFWYRCCLQVIGSNLLQHFKTFLSDHLSTLLEISFILRTNYSFFLRNRNAILEYRKTYVFWVYSVSLRTIPLYVSIYLCVYLLKM